MTTIARQLLWHDLEATAASGTTPEESRSMVTLEILRRWGILSRRQDFSLTMREAVWAKATEEADEWAEAHWGTAA